MVASVGALVSFIPVGVVSSRLGRKKVILFGVALLAASFFTGFLFKTPNFAVNIVFFLVGVAWASINVNSYPMVVEMCKGDDIGKFTGMYYTFSMAAAGADTGPVRSLPGAYRILDAFPLCHRFFCDRFSDHADGKTWRQQTNTCQE